LLILIPGLPRPRLLSMSAQFFIKIEKVLFLFGEAVEGVLGAGLEKPAHTTEYLCVRHCYTVSVESATRAAVSLLNRRSPSEIIAA
jgi:hypothetical protein